MTAQTSKANGRPEDPPDRNDLGALTGSAPRVRPPAPGDDRPTLVDSADGAPVPGDDKPSDPDDPWTQFAPEPPPPPSRLARLASRVGRFLGHEWILAGLGSIVVALAVNWTALKNPAHTIVHDVWDPTLVAYLISWGGHALATDPAHLWHLNAFYPSQYGLAYTDSFLGYAPLALIGSGPDAALLRYNLTYLLAQVLTLVGMYALARQLGSGRTGAAVAAVAFGLAPWRWGQAGHLHVISTGGIVLALAMLSRAHGFRLTARRQPGPARPWWALGGWLVAAWQVTIGFGIGLVFVYVMLGVAIVGGVWWLFSPRRRPGRRLLLADLVGGGLFAATALAMALPYLQVLKLYPQAARTANYVALFSPPLRGFFTAPPESLLWGDLHASARAVLSVPAEMDLLPGFVLYGLAVAGVFFSIWTLRVRLLLVAGVVVSIILGMGTKGPDGGQVGYLWLLEHLPGFDGLRTPGRLVIWTTLLLALLAAGGISALVRAAHQAAMARGYPGMGALARAFTLVPLLLVFVEGLNTVPSPAVPPPPAVLRSVAGPYLVLPSDTLPDMHVMLWSTGRFEPVVNGSSGFVPTELARTRQAVADFPDQSSVAYLRAMGVKTVVVLTAEATGKLADAATMPIDGLGITREVRPDGVVFHLG